MSTTTTDTLARFVDVLADTLDDVLLERAAYRLVTTDDDVLRSRLVGQLAMWDAATHDRPYDFDVERNESVAGMRTRLAEAGRRS